jgi:protein gp37
MNRSRIEWCDHEWNPITGCSIGCSKCIHNKFIRSFGGADCRYNLSKTHMYREEGELRILDSEFISETGYKCDYPFGMLPTYHRYRLDRLGTLSTGKNVLSGSIGEMFGYESWCYEEIFNACRFYSQNNYLFLSSESGYSNLQHILPAEDNMWYGSVIYSKEDLVFAEDGYHCFLYINPKEDLAINLLDSDIRVEWVVVGTGGCRYESKKRMPEKKWIENIIDYAEALRIPVFVESSLSLEYQETFKKEYPDQLMWRSGRRYFGELREKMVGMCGKCKREELKQDMIAICGRIQRGKQPQQMGYLCKECLAVVCEDYDFKNILGGTGNG